MISRRSFISSTSTGLIGFCVSGSDRLATAANSQTPDLLSLAAAHVRIAEANRRRSALWGRLGGSATERASAHLFEKQIKPYLGACELDSFKFSAYRPTRWSLAIQSVPSLASAMPTPLDARFSDGIIRAPLAFVANDSDWSDVHAKWVFVRATTQGSSARNSIRERNLYKRALEAGAARD